MREVFPLVSSGSGPFWMLVPFIVLVLFVGAILVVVLVGTRGGSVEVSGDGLRVRVPFYGRTIPLASLDLAAAREVNLNVETSLALKSRSNGVGLPSYNVGWFRLNDGGRALAAVTDPSRVAYIPTSEGFALLVSVPEPRTLLESLKRASEN